MRYIFSLTHSTPVTGGVLAAAGYCASWVPRSPHCPPAYRASHPASMVLSRLLIATPYNDSITVRRPAPRDHPSHFPDTACPKRPKPAPLSPADV